MYSFELHLKTEQIRLLDVETGQSTVLAETPLYSEPKWIGDDEILFFKSGVDSCTSLMLGDSSLDEYYMANAPPNAPEADTDTVAPMRYVALAAHSRTSG